MKGNLQKTYLQKKNEHIITYCSLALSKQVTIQKTSYLVKNMESFSVAKDSCIHLASSQIGYPLTGSLKERRSTWAIEMQWMLER